MPQQFTPISAIPFLVEQFDFDKNDVNIETIPATSKKVLSWKCKICGYEWTCSTKSRFRAQGKCPCHESNKVICKGVNDVLTIVPDMKVEYDFEKNTEIDIYKEGVNSTKSVYWKCNVCNREWTTSIHTRIQKINGKHVFNPCPHYNTVKRKYIPLVCEIPELMKFWDNEKNYLNPTLTKSTSEEKAFWICKECGYEWKLPIRTQNTAKYGNQCPCCETNRVVKQGINDLFTLVPEAKEYYDFEKNHGINIESLGVNSKITVNWKCPKCKQEWSTPIKTRIDKKGNTYRLRKCFHCYATDVSRITAVASSQEILKFWDYEKNANLEINTTSIHSVQSAHWKCPKCNYHWVSSIKARKARNGLCPCCDAKRAVSKGYNDVLTVLPIFSSIYDFEKNTNIDIYSLSPKSGVQAHFKCKNCGHCWESRIEKRISKDKDGNYRLVGCPKCDNKKYRKQNYAEQYPELASRFNREKNIRTLESITSKESTTVKLWWNCEVCGETFESSVQSMIGSLKYETKGCSFCSRTKLRKGESFAELHPELMCEYSPANTINAYTVFPNDKRHVRWICNNNPTHIWEATFAVRHAGSGKCPICHRTALIKGVNSFADKYPEFVPMWSSNNERKPDDIFYNSSLWLKWDCPTCTGEFGAYIKDIITGENVCPFCNDRMVLSGYNSFKAKYPDLLSLWSPNNLENTDDVLPHTKVCYLWICPDCNGEYSAPIKDIVNGTAICPYCEDRKVLQGYNSFKVKYPDLMKEWDWTNNYLLANADNISPRYNKAVWWNCPNNPSHHYSLSPVKRIMYNKRNREACPYCKGLRQDKRHFI